MTPSQATVRPIIHEVCVERGLTYDEIVHPGRRVIVVSARREVWRRLHAKGFGPTGISRAWGCSPQNVTDGLRLAAKGSLEAMAKVIEREARARGSTPAEILRPDRRAVVCRVRFAVFAALSDAGFSSVEIGRYFDRDHSTVLHGIAKHRAREALSTTSSFPVDASQLSHSQGERSTAVLAA